MEQIRHLGILKRVLEVDRVCVRKRICVRERDGHRECQRERNGTCVREKGVETLAKGCVRERRAEEGCVCERASERERAGGRSVCV